jgi:hypothetical protein
MAIDLARLVVAFEAETGKLQKELTTANAKLDRFEKNVTRSANNIDKRFGALGSSIKTIAGAFGIALGATFFVRLTKGAIDSADALKDMSQRTQVSIHDLASLSLAADQSGTSLDNVALMVGKLNLSVSQAKNDNKEMAESLTRLGVTATDPIERVAQLADAVSKSNDITDIAADLQKVLGRSYQETLPFLRLGAQGIRDAAAASETFANAMVRLAPVADEFNDQMAELKTNVAGLAGISLAAALPSLNQYLKALKEILATGTLLDQVKFFSVGFISEKVLNRISDAGTRVQDYNKQIFTLQQELVRLRKTAGPEASITKKWEADIARLEATRSALITQAKKDADAAAKIANAAAGAGGGSNTAALDCIADGGTWDGKRCVKKKSVTGGKSTLEGMIEQLRLQNATLGMSADQIEIYKLRLAGATSAQIAFALSVQKATNEQKKRDDAMEQGKGIAEEVRTIEEQLSVDLGQLNYLLEVGAIDWDVYSRKVLATQDAYEAAGKAAGDWIDRLMERTPTAQLEEQRKKMIELAAAYERGRFGLVGSAEAMATYVELARTELGTLDQAVEETDSLFQQLGATFTSAFEDAILSARSFGDILKGLEQDILRIITREFVAEPLEKAITDMIRKAVPTSSGGSGGNLFSGIFSGIGSLFTSIFGMAGGGFLPANQLTWVGENGPELAMSSSSARIFSNSESKQMMSSMMPSVVQHFAITGPVDKRSQGQIAAAAYSGVTRAARRYL